MNNQLVFKKDTMALTEFLKNVQPGQSLEITLSNGVSTMDGTVTVDENTTDRFSGMAKFDPPAGADANEKSEDDGDEDDMDPVQSSVLAVMSKGKA